MTSVPVRHFLLFAERNATMANQEEILDALCSYEKKPSKDIPPVLEDFLRQVAKTGETIFPWARLKPLFIRKLDQVMEQFNSEVPFDHLTPYPNVENVKYDEMRSRVIDAFEKFSGPPFTVQRICELVTEPRKHYQRSDKFLRGVEKNVMVVSTVDPFGKKISAEPPRSLMNGLELNGFSKPRDDGDGPGDSPPFPTLPPTAWSDTGPVATIWPSVFPEQTVSQPNTSANAVSETEENKTETRSSEVISSLDKLLGHKNDTDESEMICEKTESVTETSETGNSEANLDGTGNSEANLDGTGNSEANLDGTGNSKANLDGTGNLEANLDRTGTSEANVDGTGNLEANLDGTGNSEANLDNVPSKTSVTKEDGELSENSSEVLDVKQSESEQNHVKPVESSKTEPDSDSYVNKLEKDSTETNLTGDVISITDSEVKDSTDIEQGSVLETVENRAEKQEVVANVVEQDNANSSMVSEEPAPAPETTTDTDIPPIPETVQSETAHVCESSSENTAEHSQEENSYANQSEQSVPVINKDNTETESTCQSSDETTNQSAESVTSQSETETVVQSIAKVTRNEAVDQNEAAVQNEAVAQNEAEVKNGAEIQNETEAHQIEAVSQNEAAAESEAVAVQKEAETEEMEASCDENVVGSSEETPVKESEEITSSEGMDIDPGKSEGEDNEVVSTSDQGTEEPMEH